MRSFTTLTILLLLVAVGHTQQRIDGSFAFQSTNKSYSIYVPSGYQVGTPHRMMLGLHPLNPSRWDSRSWCDTLIVFAETNDLLLICPDGGPDGAIDDPIDTAFTTALLDSVYNWYSVDHDKKYVMGFSWGGKTTYTYGLLRPNVFSGYLPIGAAVNISELTTIMQSNSSGKPVYIVHGSNDSPNTRFYPLLSAMDNSGAITNSNLLSGVGHTIDFPNRNAILSVAYQWIDSVNRANISTSIASNEMASEVMIYPTVVDQDRSIHIMLSDPLAGSVRFNLRTLNGKVVSTGELNLGVNTVDLHGLMRGTYLIQLEGARQNAQRFIITE